MNLPRTDWGGALVLGCGLGLGGAALALAGNIAGAGVLAVEGRADVCRAAMRSGACDFVVNSVDEALRILKNEIRQRRPVSVGLAMVPVTALEELVERGVQPEAFAAFQGNHEAGKKAAGAFAALGTRIVDFDGALAGVAGVVNAAVLFEEYVRARGLRLEAFGFADGEALRAFDARLLQVIPAEDVRVRWCTAAPRFFHRERPHRRVVLLTEEELVRTRG